MSEMDWPEITKDTPLTEVKRIHQAIWDYAIKYGRKPDGAFWKYVFGCSVCQYVKLNNDSYNSVIVFDDFGNVYSEYIFCCDCPIKWQNNQHCPSPNSLFRRLDDEKNLLRKSNIAKQIRDLPFKYELEEKQNV